MTMKLVANRFRTRKPEAPAPQAAQPARPMQMQAAAPQLAPPQGAALGRIQPLQMPAPGGQLPNRGTKVPTGQIFSEPSDGFGDMNFATARGPSTAAPSAGPAAGAAPMPSPGDDIDAIRREGLTGRQLRMARRLAQKHNLPATSDFDAVRLLRQAGIDPFQTNSALEVVSGGDLPAGASQSRELALSGGVKLPQTLKSAGLPSVEDRAAEAHIAEVSRIQRDIVRRRRAKTIQLIARMGVFVVFPHCWRGSLFIPSPRRFIQPRPNL